MEAPLRPGEDDYARAEDDPWGNPYTLEINGDKLKVWCWGPDGQEGTEDDLSYPDE